MSRAAGGSRGLAVGLFALVLASGCRSSSSQGESPGVRASAGELTATSITALSTDAGATCPGGDPSAAGDAGTSCSAAQAASIFQYAVCSCGSVQSTGSFTTDGYDSTKGGPTGGLGANVGFDSSASWLSAVSIGGNLLSPGGIYAPKGGVVRSDLHLGGTVQAGGQTFTVDGNAYVGGTLPSSVHVLGTVTHVSSVPSPCDCSHPLSITSMVAAHAAPNNGDSAIGLSASAADAGNAQIDLPCGSFYLTDITPSKALTIAVHGHTALYVAGAVQAGVALRFSIDPGATLDLYVAGTFKATQALTLGSTASPSSCRAYVAGSGFQVPATATLACNVYAPAASVALPSAATYGAFFVGGVTASASSTVHYDTSVQNGTCATCTAASCDDGNPCSIDTCNPNGTCSHTPAANGTACPTGANLCNQTYACQAGVCTGSNPIVCTASDQCHVAGTCNSSTGQCSNPTAASGTACNDGNACDLNDTCQTGVCTAGSTVTCTAPDSCHSPGTCSTSTGVCTAPTLKAGFCSISGACVASGATNGATTCQTCQPAVSTTQYSSVSNGAACNDGNLCDSNDMCQAGVCTAGATVVCTAIDPCHVAGTCNPSTGVCSNPSAANGTTCNDGNLCTQTDSCLSGTCIGSNPVTCTALDTCHVAGSCQPATGTCTNPTAPDGTTCTGSNLCNQSYACASGACTGSSPVVCTASGQCQVPGSCNPTTGACSTESAPDGTSCNDGNPCTTSDACAGGVCGGTPVTCTASDACHAVGTCDPTSGACSNPAAPDGTACNAHNACTTGDSCAAGVCQPGSPAPFSSTSACVLETCDPVAGIVQHPCSPLDRTVSTTLWGATAFLYSGNSPIQTGVAAGAIGPTTAAVVRGHVYAAPATAGGSPVVLPGVTVTVLGHPEFGSTVTQGDGMFDMAVNGGQVLRITYALSGYLPAQRTVQTPWQNYVTASDVVLRQLDPVKTIVSLTNATTLQVARGSIQTDVDGTRTATVMIPPGTQATMTLPGGSTAPLSSMTLRATEYTNKNAMVNGNPSSTMPADLPLTSAFTYAVELSADEALAQNATEVTFSQPLPFYIEDFLAFPAGTAIPLGYFSKTLGEWVPSSSGIVLTILSVAGGSANIDVTGQGQPASATALSSLGITAAELQQLATLYAAGQSLWRVLIPHLTSWDENWGYGPPPGAAVPNVSNPQAGGSGGGGPGGCQQTGSIIKCQDQVLGQVLPVAGTPYSLHYESDRQQGRQAKVVVPIGQASLPGPVQNIQAELDIAGRVFTQTFPAQTNLPPAVFLWDGIDAYGRAVQGRQPLTVRVGNTYNPIYSNPGGGEFGGFGGITITGGSFQTRAQITLWKVWNGTVGNGEPAGLGVWDSLPEGLGGWTLNVHHTYDIGAGVLHFGDGTDLTPTSLPRILQTVVQIAPSSIAVGADGNLYEADGFSGACVRRVAPNGTFQTFAGQCNHGDFTGNGFGGDGGPATSAFLNAPGDVAFGPDGSLYIADTLNERIRRVAPTGIITTVAGSGAVGFSGDGGPATQATFNRPTGVDVAADGTIFIADSNNLRIRRVATDGTISTAVFGGGFGNPPSVPGPTLATSAYVLWTLAKVRVGPDGSLYTVEGGANGGVVRRVTPDGFIRPFAGNLAFGFGGDGGPATSAAFQHPSDAAVAPDGSVYINDGNNCTRQVTPDGLIRTAAGVPGNLGGSSGNNVPATTATFGTSAVRVGPDGTLYIGDEYGNRICKVGAPLAGFSGNVSGLLAPSTDGTQVYNFDANGRHLATQDAFTGATLYAFAYDTAGRLATVTDVNGDVTQISRDGSGNLASIVGPFGEATTFTPDPNGYMASAIDPAGLSTQLSYASGGLMQTLIDPRGGLHQFSYDPFGLLTEDQDPAGGSKVLAMTPGPNGYTTTVTTALGEQTTYVTQSAATGGFSRANTLPTGLQTSLQFATNYSTATSVPDGTTTSESDTADPRFGMLSPVPSVTTKLPSGLTSVQSTSRAFTLGTGGTLATFTEQTTLNGNVWTRAFSAGTPRTWTTTSPVGRVTTMTVDVAGRPLQISINATPAVTPWEFLYDSHGRLTQMAQGTRLWTTGYDPNGYANSQTDPLSHTVSTANDLDGRPLITALQDQREVGTTWDGDNNMSSITLPGGLATQPDPTREHQFSFTPVDLTQTYTPPAISTGLPSTTYSYDVDRFLKTITRPDGVVVTHVPDSFERLSQIVYPQGTLGYGYSPTTGLLQSTTTPAGETTSFGFDGFLPKTITWSGPVAGSITFGYNTDFRVNSQSLNGGTGLSFGYDNDGLLNLAGSLTVVPDPQNGRLSATTLGAVTDAYGYDTNGLLASYAATYSGTPVYTESIVSRDLNGRITEKTDVLAGTSHDWKYVYDPAGRLTDVTEDGAAVSHYDYDGDDNRTTFTGTSGTINPTYDVQDRLSTYGPATYGFTANGELISKTVGSQTTSYAYDALGNLLNVTLPAAAPDGAQTIGYIVDGQNRRVGRKVNGTLVQGWLYQDQLRVVAQVDGSGTNVVARFVYGSKANVPDYMVTSGGTYRILSDHLGSPRLVVDIATGNAIETINYDEFGNETDTLAGTLPTGYVRIPFGFAGGLYDPDTGLVRFGARDYDATTGRWTAKDPIGFNGGLNVYVYVENDPVNWIDPTGLAEPTGPGDYGPYWDCVVPAAKNAQQCIESCKSSKSLFNQVCDFFSSSDSSSDCQQRCSTDFNSQADACRLKMWPRDPLPPKPPPQLPQDPQPPPPPGWHPPRNPYSPPTGPQPATPPPVQVASP